MHGVTVKIRSSSNNKQCLLPKSRGDKTQGVPSLHFKKYGDMSPCPPTDLRPYIYLIIIILLLLLLLLIVVVVAESGRRAVRTRMWRFAV